MSAELPDFTTAPAWMDRHGEVWEAQGDCVWDDYNDCLLPVKKAESLAPWTPLDTAEGHVQRIDLDKLAELLGALVDDWRDDDDEQRPFGEFAIDAVLAALPELMGGESDE